MSVQLSETQQHVLALLDAQTRRFDSHSIQEFTSAAIAQALSISRNLANQYLNDLVRQHLLVRAGARPVYFFHRRSLERYLGRRLDDDAFTSLDFLFAGDQLRTRGFARAIGREGSLLSCIDQCLAALRYPPSGLPLLLMGEEGTGRRFLAKALFEYGQDHGLFSESAMFSVVDCTDMRDTDGTFDKLFEQVLSHEGLVVFERAELLRPTEIEQLFQGQRSRISSEHRIQLVFSATLPNTPESSNTPSASGAERLSCSVPVVAHVPSFQRRSSEERTELAFRFLRMESARMGLDISIGRSALRRLIEMPYSDNINGLKSAITYCCARSFRFCQGDRLEIYAYQLPIALVEGLQGSDRNDVMIDVAESGSACVGSDRLIVLLDSMIERLKGLRADNGQFDSAERSVERAMRDVFDYLTFNQYGDDEYTEALEHVVWNITEEANIRFRTSISPRSARILSQALSMQVFSSTTLAAWCCARKQELLEALSLIARRNRLAAAVSSFVLEGVRSSLGIQANVLDAVLHIGSIDEEVGQLEGHRTIGVILSHGYATATSMADAVNRMLQQHVFEAINMTYEMELGDVLQPLQTIIARYEYCTGIALLVDTGSLEHVHEDLKHVGSMDIGVMNNASTALALEVGSALINGKSVEEALAHAASSCPSRYRMFTASPLDDAIIFCSENGVKAADQIRNLLIQALPHEIELKFLTADFNQLVSSGASDPLFDRYRVRAIIGTMDPAIEHIPFVALENIISVQSGGLVDRIFSAYFDAEGLAQFHANLLRDMSLQNVIRSITILNPELLFHDIEDAVQRLQTLLGKRIENQRIIGIYVHLCCMVERLVTRAPFQGDPDESEFALKHRAFIDCFNKSFETIVERYHIAVPVNEVSYVHDYIYDKPLTSGLRGEGGTRDE